MQNRVHISICKISQNDLSHALHFPTIIYNIEINHFGVNLLGLKFWFYLLSFWCEIALILCDFYKIY